MCNSSRILNFVYLASLLALAACGGNGPAAGHAPVGIPAPKGDSFNNGGGYGEQLITYAWAGLPTAWASCLASASCAVDRDAAAALASVLGRETGGVKFLEPAEFAALGDRASVAVMAGVRTGAEVGSPIYFDADQLESKEPRHQERWTLPLAQSVLIAALARHRAVTAPAAENLRAALEKYVGTRQETISLAVIGFPGMDVLAVATGERSTDLLVGESGALENLGAYFLQAYACPLSGERARWATFAALSADVASTGEAIVRATHARFACGDRTWYGEIRFWLSLEKGRDGEWHWAKDKSHIEGIGLATE